MAAARCGQAWLTTRMRGARRPTSKGKAPEWMVRWVPKTATMPSGATSPEFRVSGMAAPSRQETPASTSTIGTKTPSTRCSGAAEGSHRSEEHTSELQSLMRISYAVFCLKKKIIHHIQSKQIDIRHHCTEIPLSHTHQQQR